MSYRTVGISETDDACNTVIRTWVLADGEDPAIAMAVREPDTCHLYPPEIAAAPELPYISLDSD